MAEAFKIPEADRARYGSSTLGDSCILARDLVRADAGTRFISISHNGWDLHADMFDPKNKRNHYGLTRELDGAFSALLNDLAATRANEPDAPSKKPSSAWASSAHRWRSDKGRDHNGSAFPAMFATTASRAAVFWRHRPNGVEVLQLGVGREALHPEDVIVAIWVSTGQKIIDTRIARLRAAVRTDFVRFRGCPICLPEKEQARSSTSAEVGRPPFEENYANPETYGRASHRRRDTLIATSLGADRHSRATPGLSRNIRFGSKRASRFRCAMPLAFSTDLYFPVGADPKLPVILIRTPTTKSVPRFEKRCALGQGYIVAVQDTRGRYTSEGNYTAFAGGRHRWLRH